MNVIVWTPAFSVGYEPIDKQHQVIVDLYNGLCADLSGSAMELAEQKLGDYIDGHFRFEDVLMERTGYAKRMAHLADHRRLIDMYKVIQARDQNKSTVMKIVVYKWFVEHVVSDEMDRDLGRFLSEQLLAGKPFAAPPSVEPPPAGQSAATTPPDAGTPSR